MKLTTLALAACVSLPVAAGASEVLPTEWERLTHFDAALMVKSCPQAYDYVAQVNPTGFWVKISINNGELTQVESLLNQVGYRHPTNYCINQASPTRQQDFMPGALGTIYRVE